MDALEAMTKRRSHKRLFEPTPSDAELTKMLEVAASAPDHKELQPWRFVVLRGDARTALGDAMVEGYRRRESEHSQGRMDKLAAAPMRAPVIVAVAAARMETKLPFVELVSATCAAIQNLLLAATAMGYGSIWRTGAHMQDEYVKEWLGLDGKDELLAFVYLGTPQEPLPMRELPGIEDVTTWRS